MKPRDCKVGMHVRDSRTGRTYRVVEKRVLASDAGAYCSPLEKDPTGQHNGGLIYWEHLEPLDGGEGHG